MNYYNEIDPYAAAWLRNLIAAGHIAPGEVDERSISDVKPDDLRGYTQCHFFAGIGVWSYALRRAGWRDDEPVWTGSCPCQPFSAAGKRGGEADERHLWPHWFHLIAHGKPRDVPVLGEQVASKDGLAWLDLVHADLEGQGYAVGALDLCAAGVGAPHIRQRLFFVADAESFGQRRESGELAAPEGNRVREVPRQGARFDATNNGGAARESADPNGRDAGAEGLQRSGEHGQQPQDGGAGRGMADDAEQGWSTQPERPGQQDRRPAPESGRLRDARGIVGHADDTGPQARRSRGPVNGFWHPAYWLPCIDGKARPVEPKYVALVDGPAAGVGLVRPCHDQESEEIDASQIDGDGQGSVRTLRQDELQAARSPSGREPREQRPLELADFVRFLPSSLALAKLHGDTATEKALLALLEASGAQRLMQYPSHQIETAWASLGKEVQDRFRLALGKGRFVRTVEHPLAHGAPARVGRLRAYGNAIVGPLAEEFIRAYREVRGLALT